MEGTNVYYVVKKGALPEVLLKVVEANRLIDTQKAASVQEAAEALIINIKMIFSHSMIQHKERR